MKCDNAISQLIPLTKLIDIPFPLPLNLTLSCIRMPRRDHIALILFESSIRRCLVVVVGSVFSQTIFKTSVVISLGTNCKEYIAV